jgi:hypothetical protein
MCHDGISIEARRCLGDIAIVWQTKLSNNRIFRSNQMFDECSISILMSIYKNKEDIQVVLITRELSR